MSGGCITISHCESVYGRRSILYLACGFTAGCLAPKFICGFYSNSLSQLEL